MSLSRLSRLIIPGCIIVMALYLGYKSVDLAQYEQHGRQSLPVVTGTQAFLSTGILREGPASEQWIIDLIDTTKNRALVSVYTFTVPSLREALLRAKQRGVDVRIILEKNPYESGGLNRDTKKFFQDNNISFHESDASQFAFMHAKYMLFDDTWIVETANWTRASFATNREFFYTDTDPSIAASLARIFEGDYVGGRGTSSDIRLLAGPTNAHERLGKFIREADTNIQMYAASLSDKEILDALTDVCHAGKSVMIQLAYHAEDKEESGPIYDTCLEIHLMKKKPLHAKVIIRDQDEAFVGSFNFTNNSLTKNREVGVFISGTNVGLLSKWFSDDWARTEVALR